MSNIYFVRHGQSVWNIENKICGATDVPLTEEGHRQAIETGENILAQGIKVDEILCSPLSRAADTAKHIGEIIGVPVRVEPRLIEQNFGTFESTPRKSPEFAAAKRQHATHYGGGESAFQVVQRIYNLLDDLKKESLETGKTYMLVAHNGLARVINSYFYDMDNEEYADFGVKNCAVVKYEFD